jgi:phospho-N-acetylmuramoyl-pentapeptide-transferase
MLYWLTSWSDGGDFFNLFRYITFRAGGAFLTALIFGFLFGRPLINVLRRSRARASRSATTAPKATFRQGRHADDGRAC